jgi:type I restriction enzyme M protein
VPNGVLFGDGVAARIKQRLLEECNLHTIVRLPAGVFAPYTDIATNLVFFEKTGRTKAVWFYEIPPPQDRKKYSKTHAMRFEEFGACQEWWDGSAREGRVENEFAWRVPIGEIEQDGFNLDRPNPHQAGELGRRPPEELIAELIETEHEIARLLSELESEIRTPA